jgi:hypothetical protein
MTAAGVPLAKALQMRHRYTVEPHEGLLRAWHLAVLRFALTRDNADRLGILAIANEIDRLGRVRDIGLGFSFFRKTSAELCAAMLRRQEGDDVVLNRYLAEVDDIRLHRALTAALEVPQRQPNLGRKRVRPNLDLWRGLPSRTISRR